MLYKKEENVMLLTNNGSTIGQRNDIHSVINWFSDIQHKNQHTFAVFDIENFYPSITKKLLTDSICFAKQYTTISDLDNNIIMHSRKPLLFKNSTAWSKKDKQLLWFHHG